MALGAALTMTVPAYAQQSSGTTHQFQATEYYNTFSFAHPPALRIAPGDRVVTRTIDAAGFDENGNAVASGPNPQIGPFYVEGSRLLRDGEERLVAQRLRAVLTGA